MGIIHFLLHLSGVVAVRRSLSVSNVFDHLIAETGYGDKFGFRSSALQKLMNLQSNQATPGVAGELADVKNTLDNQVVDFIQAGHQAAGAAVTAAVQALNTTTAAAFKDKADSDAAYSSMSTCYGQQKSALAVLEQAKTKLGQDNMTKGLECAKVATVDDFSATFQQIVFTCDMSVDAGCANAIAQLKKKRTDQLGTITQNRDDGKTTYDTQVQSCSDATDVVATQERVVSQKGTAFDNKVTECGTAKTNFNDALCVKLATSLREKCTAFDNYNNVLSQIDSSNTDLSQQDRANEWEMSQLTSCILGESASKEVDSSTVAGCREKSVSYTGKFGTLNRKQSTVDQLMVEQKFTCSEVKISFDGVWSIPADPASSSAAYKKNETISYNVGVNYDSNAIFDVC